MCCISQVPIKIQWNTRRQMVSLPFRFYTIQFWPRLCPGSHTGAYDAPQTTQLAFEGETPSVFFTLSTPMAFYCRVLSSLVPCDPLNFKVWQHPRKVCHTPQGLLGGVLFRSFSFTLALQRVTMWTANRVKCIWFVFNSRGPIYKISYDLS